MAHIWRSKDSLKKLNLSNMWVLRIEFKVSLGGKLLFPLSYLISPTSVLFFVCLCFEVLRMEPRPHARALPCQPHSLQC